MTWEQNTSGGADYLDFNPDPNAIYHVYNDYHTTGTIDELRALLSPNQGWAKNFF